MSPRRTVFLAMLVILVSGCGGAAGTGGASGPPAASPSASPDATIAAPEPSFPITIDAANGDVTVQQQPSAVVSLSPTATEMLFAIDAGAQVVAADDFSNYPADAPTTNLSALEPNIEAIADYGADLVVFATEPGDLESSMDELGVPALQLPAAETLEDVYAQIEQLGAATGHIAEAVELTAQMRSDIERITEDLPELEPAPTYYHELDDTYFSVTSDTFIGQVYGLLGLDNIADAVDDQAGGYPQLSAEFILEADPDLVFLADTKCCGQSAQTVADRPGWSQLTAVREDGVIELDDDVASRWGPRIVELLSTVASAAQQRVPASRS